MFVHASVMVPASVTVMPFQSLAKGEVAFPSLLVSPPTLSSCNDVNVTGAPDVPAAVSVPRTSSADAEPPPQGWKLLLVPLTTVPAAIVTVTLDGTDSR